MTSMSSTARPMSWQTPAVMIAAGCTIAMLSFGPRSAVGQFLTPMSLEYHWGRDVFGFALAIQNLLWGVFQPFAGGVADRYGYQARFLPVGPEDPRDGPPTQLAVFAKGAQQGAQKRAEPWT